jgi:hypothetical protein|tara:strand:+ start:46 stop:186 length:141 start_codon:yes stop_codon:yes gene_type:complete
MDNLLTPERALKTIEVIDTGGSIELLGVVGFIIIALYVIYRIYIKD